MTLQKQSKTHKRSKHFLIYNISKQNQHLNNNHVITKTNFSTPSHDNTGTQNNQHALYRQHDQSTETPHKTNNKTDNVRVTQN